MTGDKIVPFYQEYYNELRKDIIEHRFEPSNEYEADAIRASLAAVFTINKIIEEEKTK